MNSDRYFYNDRLGSLRYTGNGANGSLIGDFLRYEAFGQKMKGAGDATTQPSDFSFAEAWGVQSEYSTLSAHGKVGEPGLGLQLMGQRYYDPMIGRFISPDPIGYAGGLNLYAYADNDPVNFVDPEGLFRVPISISKKYPKAYNRLQSLIKRLNSKKYNAYGAICKATKKKVNEAFTPGKGPLLKIVSGNELGDVEGGFDRIAGNQNLLISETLLYLYETDAVKGTALDISVEHELTHYFDFYNKVNRPGEEGYEYERRAYGKATSWDDWKTNKGKLLFP